LAKVTISRVAAGNRSFFQRVQTALLASSTGRLAPCHENSAPGAGSDRFVADKESETLIPGSRPGREFDHWISSNRSAGFPPPIEFLFDTGFLTNL
jgi:hypothetical protein